MYENKQLLNQIKEQISCDLSFSVSMNNIQMQTSVPSPFLRKKLTCHGLDYKILSTVEIKISRLFYLSGIVLMKLIAVCIMNIMFNWFLIWYFDFNSGLCSIYFWILLFFSNICFICICFISGTVLLQFVHLQRTRGDDRTLRINKHERAQRCHQGLDNY